MEYATTGRGRTSKLSSTRFMRRRSSRVGARPRLPTPMAEGPAKASHPLLEKVFAAKPPIAELIGFEIVEIGEGRAVGSLQAGPQHANPMGTLHGGVLCDLTDAAMGMGFASTLAPDESVITIDPSIHFLRPVLPFLFLADC